MLHYNCSHKYYKAKKYSINNCVFLLIIRNKCDNTYADTNISDSNFGSFIEA